MKRFINYILNSVFFGGIIGTYIWPGDIAVAIVCIVFFMGMLTPMLISDQPTTKR
jgi:hypothetical protein